MLLAGAVVVQAQGTVSLGNFASAIPTYLYISYHPVSGGANTLLGGANTGPAPTALNYADPGVIANGNDWTVEIFGAIGSGLSSVALGPTGATAHLATGSSGDHDAIAGTWGSTADAVFSSAPNGTVATIQLVAWYSGTGDTFDQAETAGLPWGESATQNVTLGAPPGTPAVLPVSLGNFTVQTTVPEPSTIALGVIGASAFLMRLRRKQ